MRRRLQFRKVQFQHLQQGKMVHSVQCLHLLLHSSFVHLLFLKVQYPMYKRTIGIGDYINCAFAHFCLQPTPGANQPRTRPLSFSFSWSNALILFLGDHSFRINPTKQQQRQRHTKGHIEPRPIMINDVVIDRRIWRHHG